MHQITPYAPKSNGFGLATLIGMVSILSACVSTAPQPSQSEQAQTRTAPPATEPLPPQRPLSLLDQVLLREEAGLAPEERATVLSSESTLIASRDLNNDGSPEHFALLQAPYFCGSGGCTALLFDNQARLLNRFTVTTTPVLVAREQQHGWHDLIIASRDGLHRLRHNGQGYPSNPSIEPRVERRPVEAKAYRLAQQQPIYVEDGHSLTVLNPPLLGCFECFELRFDHYGDPDSDYRIRIDVIDGVARLSPEQPEP